MQGTGVGGRGKADSALASYQTFEKDEKHHKNLILLLISVFCALPEQYGATVSFKQHGKEVCFS